MSTSTAISSVISWINERLEKYVIGIFLDISVVFDNVRWDQLDLDMRVVGCSNRTRRIIFEYLRNRKAYIEIGEHRCVVEFTRGVPEGSKLGPSIWNITMDTILKIDIGEATKMVA